MALRRGGRRPDEADESDARGWSRPTPAVRPKQAEESRTSAAWLNERSHGPHMSTAATTTALLHLQRTAGNAALSVEVAQRQAAPPMNVEEFIDDPAIPGLTAAVARQAREAMTAGRRQDAIDIIVDYLVEAGQIDRALLRGGRIRYDGSLAGEGVATVPGFRVVDGRRVANPTRVRMGRANFVQGLSWLYSSILHEYRHVEQFQQTYAADRPLSGQQNWLAARQEVEAYAHEIINSRQTGVFNNPRLMRELWRRLQFDHWIGTDREGRRALNDVYVRAHEIAQEAVGPDVELRFSPAAP